jgi:hypothetical protein
VTAHTWIEPVCAFYIGVALKGLSHSYDVAGSASRISGTASLSG